jgi:GTPase SAR1 family protein
MWNVVIRDTVGQERYFELTKGFFRSCHGMLIIFDLTALETFERLEGWIKIASKESHVKNIILVGNKADLTRQRIITRDMVDKLLDNHPEMRYYETSAKDNINVDTAFSNLCTMIIRSQERRPSTVDPPKHVKVPKTGICSLL